MMKIERMSIDPGMKPGSAKVWIVVAAIILGLLLTACGQKDNGPKASSAELDTDDASGAEPEGSIRYFLFTESNGGDFDRRTSYELEYEDGTYTAEIKPESVPHDETLTVTVDEDFADRLKAVITENNAWSWDGYDEAADVLDGIGFTLHVKTSDGSGIDAVGYMEWPPNFNDTAAGFHELFLEAYEKNS